MNTTAHGSAYKPAREDGVPSATFCRVMSVRMKSFISYQLHVVTADAAKTIVNLHMVKSENAAWKKAASLGYTETVKPRIRNKR